MASFLFFFLPHHLKNTYLAALDLSCSTQDVFLVVACGILVPRLGIEPGLGSAESLSHYTSREVPDGEVFNKQKWIWTLSDLVWMGMPTYYQFLAS